MKRGIAEGLRQIKRRKKSFKKLFLLFEMVSAPDSATLLTNPNIPQRSNFHKSLSSIILSKSLVYWPTYDGVINKTICKTIQIVKGDYV